MFNLLNRLFVEHNRSFLDWSRFFSKYLQQGAVGVPAELSEILLMDWNSCP